MKRSLTGVSSIVWKSMMSTLLIPTDITRSVTEESLTCGIAKFSGNSKEKDMKKVVFVLFFGFILVTMGCTNKAELEELKKQNEELTQNNENLRLKVEEISAENEKLISENSDLLSKLEDLEKEKRILELRNEEIQYVHNQILDFKFSGFDTKVFQAPFSDNVIYTIQKGDTIEVLNILTYKSVDNTFSKIFTQV